MVTETEMLRFSKVLKDREPGTPTFRTMIEDQVCGIGGLWRCNDCVLWWEDFHCNFICSLDFPITFFVMDYFFFRFSHNFSCNGNFGNSQRKWNKLLGPTMKTSLVEQFLRKLVKKRWKSIRGHDQRYI